MKKFALSLAVLISCVAADFATAAPACATCNNGACVSNAGGGSQRGGPIRRGLRRLFGRRCR